MNVVELHDCFSTNELITYEALVSYCLPPLYATDSVMYCISLNKSLLQCRTQLNTSLVLMLGLQGLGRK